MRALATPLLALTAACASQAAPQRPTPAAAEMHATPAASQERAAKASVGDVLTNAAAWAPAGDDPRVAAYLRCGAEGEAVTCLPWADRVLRLRLTQTVTAVASVPAEMKGLMLEEATRRNMEPLDGEGWLGEGKAGALREAWRLLEAGRCVRSRAAVPVEPKPALPPEQAAALASEAAELLGRSQALAPEVQALAVAAMESGPLASVPQQTVEYRCADARAELTLRFVQLVGKAGAAWPAGVQVVSWRRRAPADPAHAPGRP